MTRFIDQADMSADQIIQCSYQALAILNICKRVADDLPDNKPAVSIGADLALTLGLARDLVCVMHDALETHEGLRKGDSQ